MDGTVVKAKSIQREQELVKIEGQRIEGPKNWADFYGSMPGGIARARARALNSHPSQ